MPTFSEPLQFEGKSEFRVTELSRQRLEVRLTKINPKNGTAVEGDSNVLEINGANITEFDLQVESYGFVGSVEMLPKRFEHKFFKQIVGFIGDFPVRIDVCYQHKKNDYQKEKGDYQLLFSGYLEAQNSFSQDHQVTRGDSIYSKGGVFVQKSVLSFQFCDPLQFWLKQQGLNEVFQKKTYQSAFEEILKPFHQLFTLSFSEKLDESLRKNTKRLIWAMTSFNAATTAYDYLLTILKKYSAQLQLNFSEFISVGEKVHVELTPLQESNEHKPSFWQGVSPHLSTYNVVPLVTGDKTEAILPKDNDWRWLKAVSHRNVAICQTQYAIQNIYPSKDIKQRQLPEKNTETLCTQFVRHPYKQPDGLEGGQKNIIGSIRAQGAPQHVTEYVFSGMPLFAEELVPLGLIKAQFKIEYEYNQFEQFNFLGEDPSAVCAVRLNLKLIENGLRPDLPQIDTSSSGLSNYSGGWHNLTFSMILIEQEKAGLLLPELQKLPEFELMQGVVVAHSPNQEQSDKAPKYLYDINPVKGDDLNKGFSLDPAQEEEMMYWVEIPAFKNDGQNSSTIIPVPVKMFQQAGQQFVPLKNGTKVSLKCFLEHVEVDEVLASNLAKPVSGSVQTEASFWGAGQEMSMCAESDSAGKNQKLTTTLDIQGDQAQSHSLAFNAETGSTILKAVSGKKE